MPVSFFVGENDGACSADMAQWYADQIGNLQNHYVFTGWGHMEPANYQADGYHQLLLDEVDGTLLQ